VDLPSQPLPTSTGNVTARGGRLLGSIFWEVAAVPQAPLTLKNTAAVVRYLLWLARRGVPKSLVKSDRKAIDQYRREVDIEAGRPCIKHRRIREQTTRLAMGIRGDILQQAVITPATADQTRRFLNECQLHLMGYPELEAAHKMIVEFAVPADSDDPFKPPTLLSLHSRTTGGKPYRDDLLERIYAAHHALVTSGIRPAGRLVADALNNRKARHRLSDSEPRTWDDSHVKDRIKSPPSPTFLQTSSAVLRVLRLVPKTANSPPSAPICPHLEG